MGFCPYFLQENSSGGMSAIFELMAGTLITLLFLDFLHIQHQNIYHKLGGVPYLTNLQNKQTKRLYVEWVSECVCVCVPSFGAMTLSTVTTMTLATMTMMMTMTMTMTMAMVTTSFRFCQGAFLLGERQRGFPNHIRRALLLLVIKNGSFADTSMAIYTEGGHEWAGGGGRRGSATAAQGMIRMSGVIMGEWEGWVAMVGDAIKATRFGEFVVAGVIHVMA